MTTRIEAAPLDDFLDQIGDATDLTSGSAFAEGMLEAADIYMESMRERFDLYSGGGGDWAPHAPSTVKRRGANAGILFDKGDLWRSLNRDGENHLLEVDHDTIREGSTDPKAKFHQQGTENMPARVILDEPSGTTMDAMKHAAAIGLQQSAKDAARGR
jgi:hypothetical protein